MKLKYHSILLFFLLFLENGVHARVILDKKIFYAKLDGQVDLKFGYAFNQDSFKDKPKDKISSYSNLRLLYLQRIYPNTQMGFNVKVGISGITNLKALDIEKLDIEEGYFIIKNQRLGSIEYGKKSLVSQSMLINTSKIYTAGGGVNGDWANYANLRGGDNDSKVDCGSEKKPKKCDGAGYDKDNTFWVKPDIYSNYHGLKLGFKQPLISYISPEIYNFKLGFSYVPGRSNLGYNNLIAGGFSYHNSLSDDINFTTALTGEFARENFTDCISNPSDQQCHNQLLHWNFGLNVKSFNFDWIFSYGNSGKSGRKISPETTNTYYTNAGVAYNSDARKLSLTYFNSGREITDLGAKELTSYSISLEYQLAVGTSYYLDIVKFNTKEPKVINNNSGYVLLAGLKLNF
jgi:hypothetical protein